MADLPVTERLRRATLLIWAVIGAVLLVAMLLWLAGRVRIVWLPLVFAGGLVVVLDPIVRGLQRIAVPRFLGTLFGFMVLGALFAAIGFLVVPAVREQASDFGLAIPALYDQVVATLHELGDRFGIDLGPVWTSETIRIWISNPSNQTAIQDLIGGFGSGAGRVLAGITELVAVVILAPVLAFYLLLDLPRSRAMMLDLTPPRLREEVAYVSSQLGRALGAFVRGQLMVAIFVGILSAIALRVLDLPFWLIIGLATGFLNMVPLVGPFIGGAVAAGVALLGGRPTAAIAIAVVFTLIQQVDNHIITPLVQRTRVRLSPLVIVLALIMGGAAAGFLGVLVAVPLVTIARILAGHVWRTRVLGESWAEASEKMLEETEPPERLRSRRRSSVQPRLFDTTEIEPVRGEAPEPAGTES